MVATFGQLFMLLTAASASSPAEVVAAGVRVILSAIGDTRNGELGVGCVCVLYTSDRA